MQLTRKDYSHRQREINAHFQLAVHSLFADTPHFHAYVITCIVHKGHRYTVALIPVAKGTPRKEVVQTLLKQCRNDE